MIKIIILIIVLLILFFIYKSIEQFVNVDILNDFYITSKQSVDLDLDSKKINTSRICIFKKDTNYKIIDYECINANELLPILKLTDHRTKTVCVDGNCLNKDDLKILNGSSSFKLKNKSSHLNFKDKCIGGHADVKLRRCGYFTKKYTKRSGIKEWYGQFIKSLSPQACDSEHAFEYKLEPGYNSDKNLKREDYKLTQEPNNNNTLIGFNEGHS